MKKFISILLLGTLLVYTSGNFLFFKYKEHVAKQEMKAFIKANPNSKLAMQLSFSEKDIAQGCNNFKWEEENKEFSYNGELYDVVTHSTLNGVVHILAIKDKNENLLNEHYTSLLKNQSNKKSTTITFLKLFTSAFVKTNHETTIYSFNRIACIHQAFYQYFITSIALGILVPPPQI